MNAPVRTHTLAAIVVDADTRAECLVDFDEWTALLEWLEFHGIDPKRVPAGTRIERHAGQCLISYVRILVHEKNGQPKLNPNRHPGNSYVFATEAAIEQGEAPPLPFPDVVARWLL